MHEIEVKARVADKEKLVTALEDMGVRLGGADSQRDTIYTTGDWESIKDDPDRIIFRIRRQTGRDVLTMKRNGAAALHSIEHETAVADAMETHNMLGALGYAPFIRVTKVRRKGRLGEIEVCLDEVEGLGTFVELERLVGDGEATAGVEEELLALLGSLGVAVAQRETLGYDTLMRLKKEGAS